MKGRRGQRGRGRQMDGGREGGRERVREREKKPREVTELFTYREVNDPGFIHICRLCPNSHTCSPVITRPSPSVTNEIIISQ